MRDLGIISGLGFIVLSVIGCAQADHRAQLDRLVQEKQRLLRENISLRTKLQLCQQSKPLQKRKTQPVTAPPERSRPRSLSLPAYLADKGVRVLSRKDGMAICIPADLIFARGLSKLTNKGKRLLAGIAKTIKAEFPGASIRIDGHADTRPIRRSKKRYKTNWELSGARALSVLHYLINSQKFDPRRVSFAGYSFYRPIDPKRKRCNRRVEIVILE